MSYQLSLPFDFSEELFFPFTIPVPPEYNKDTAHRGDLAKTIPPEFLERVRKIGFPYFEYDDIKYKLLFWELTNYDLNKVVKEGVIKQCPKFSKLASVFFPQIYEVEIPGKKTPMQSFLDDKQLSIALELSSEKGVKSISRSDLRSNLGFVNGSQCVSNFRPEVAKYLYDTYAHDGLVYDYSMGWGGRMVGFMASKAKMYVGVDVAERNFAGYNTIMETYGGMIKEKKVIKAFRRPAEEFTHERLEGKVDFAFSSPPYFGKEKYSDDLDQSFIRYTNIDSWLSGFLGPTVDNCKYLLKPGGTLGMNIANIIIKAKEHKLVDYAREIILERGFTEIETLVYDIPRAPGTGTKREPEPIMLFKRN